MRSNPTRSCSSLPSSSTVNENRIVRPASTHTKSYRRTSATGETRKKGHHIRRLNYAPACVRLMIRCSRCCRRRCRRRRGLSVPPSHPINGTVCHCFPGSRFLRAVTFTDVSSPNWPGVRLPRRQIETLKGRQIETRRTKSRLLSLKRILDLRTMLRAG